MWLSRYIGCTITFTLNGLILAALPSKCAETAVLEFLAREKHIILDLACGIGSDAFCLESYGLAVIGVDAV
jgi:2-polyprenyl-3-methyl-5-hydroxy-6-metoxy-1,4-benzoquinol methylase